MAVNALEDKLNEAFVKNAPVQLPANVRKVIVEWNPWISLILGVLQLWAAWALYNASRVADSFVDYANNLSRAFGGTEVVTRTSQNLFFWLAMVALVATGVLMVAAFSGLKARRKAGWNLLFYAAMVNAVYGVLYLFADQGSMVFRFVMSLIGTVIGLYFLFQIRGHYASVRSEVAPTKKA